ncbi:Outer membrane protein transport protein [Sulfidibacter corallicola]|uniref:Outer membrane protein transport protein n=1 Tax=Sulfidibacter corallicola TaxID=2818388 RepID=A0A8A4TJD4_SULCO|nr:outer membrane protein transport protein [Sulfidibacter corallicola]QTD48951.1 outer membrane protein transport protein [Sulfidibacter corallicola]
MWSYRISLRHVVVLALCFVCFQSSLMAGGYQVSEQSARGLARAFSGVTTGLGDGSSVWFNPAAMSREGDVASFAANVLSIDAEFQNQGSTVAGAFPTTGGSGGNGPESAVVPSAYIVKSFGDKIRIGGSINAPFGLATEFDSDWVGRYHATESELRTIAVNLALSYEFNDRVALGVGINYYQMDDAKIAQHIDFGTIGFSVLGPAQATALGLAPQMNDGSVEITGDDKKVSFNVGGLFNFTDHTRLGIGYRHEVEGSLDGRADFTIPAGYEAVFSQFVDPNGRPLFADSGGFVDITLPTLVFVGLTHEFGNVSLGLDVQWADWTVFPELRVVYSETGRVDSVVETEWDEATRISLGFDWQVNEDWVWRAGIADEETPIPAPENRTPRIPDNDRLWLTTGFTYNHGPWAFDFAYAYIDSDNAGVSLPSSTDFLNGEFELGGDIFTLGLVYNF